MNDQGLIFREGERKSPVRGEGGEKQKAKPEGKRTGDLSEAAGLLSEGTTDWAA